MNEGRIVLGRFGRWWRRWRWIRLGGGHRGGVPMRHIPGFHMIKMQIVNIDGMRRIRRHRGVLWWWRCGDGRLCRLIVLSIGGTLNGTIGGSLLSISLGVLQQQLLLLILMDVAGILVVVCLQRRQKRHVGRSQWHGSEWSRDTHQLASITNARRSRTHGKRRGHFGNHGLIIIVVFIQRMIAMMMSRFFFNEHGGQALFRRIRRYQWRKWRRHATCRRRSGCQ
mmetsp:Transcript_25354/g.52760  ORF Transcript_25354/g.52760 Transcript_25354/m.52760 type:complete len:224 (+) Transcript_25354:1336-2007(+)